MIGTSVSHYKILDELGRGGMGVVYKARDTKLNRTVALKFLPPHLTMDEDATARFMREAQAAAAIEHPNICTIHEISETGDGQTFIVMGYYGGQTLRKRMDGGGRSEEGDTVGIATQVLQGLAAAHSAGIVHRDIKPGNIIVADDGHVRILDFGLAKLASGVDITRDGSTSGTAAYMSPEQVNGDEADARSDLWSFGVMLYEMLTGTRPFTGEYDQAISYAIVNKEAEPVESVGDNVPPVLAVAVARALQKDPSGRFQSAAEFIEALAPLTSPAAVRGTFLDSLQQPKVAIPLAAAIIILAFFGYRWFDNQSKIRWAREAAVPEIERLTNERDRAAAFRLGLEARTYLAGDPTFERAFGDVSARAWFASEPSGAEVYWKRYGEPDERWTLVGTTPIDSVLFPAEPVHVSVRKTNYNPIDNLVFAGHNEFALDPIGEIPTDIVRIPGGDNPVRIVGIDHIEPQAFQTFFLGKYEVTNAEFKVFVDAGGYENPDYWENLPLPFGDAMARFTDRSGRPGPSTWEAGAFPTGLEANPVAGVSWFEAAAYAKFVGKALPTVYHWNAAAWTAIAYMIVPKSNMPGDGPAAVGSYQGMGPHGTFDLAGNVREWLVNPTQTGERYILGGGWNDPPYAYNDAYAQDPFDRSETNGFRTMEYAPEELNLEALQASIERPERDFSTEEPVSDAEFDSILRTFEYDKTPLNAQIEAVEDSAADWVHETISFDAAYGNERVSAHLFLPRKGRPPYQTLVYFPGSNAIHDRAFSGTLHGFIDFVVLDGRAVLIPIYKGTYERGDELDSDYPEETVFYKDRVAMWAKDLMRSIDYLETRDDIDTGNLAYYGISWGGAMGPIMTAVEPRFKASVLLVAGLMFQTTLPEAEALNFVPRVKVPTLMLNGRYDHFFPVETSQKPMFELLDLPADQKRMVVSELGHTISREELMREMFAWLDRWLD